MVLATLDMTSVVLICFVSLTLMIGAVLLLVRDLRRGSKRLAPVPVARDLRRTRDVFDQRPAETLSGQWDQSFDRLVLESGLEIVPLAVFLMLLACGLLSGGLLFLIYDNPLAAIAGMAVGMALPLVALQYRRNRRMRDIKNQLAHVIDLLARAVRAGESLDQAITLVGNESGGPLGPEFQRCARQLDMGQAIPTVLRSLANRIRLIETRILASTLMVHRQTGGNLAEALDRMSAVVRDRLNYQRQMRASTGAGRLSAILIATISPVMYVLMLMWLPEHFGILFDDSLGRLVLASAFILEIVGIIWVYRLLRSEA